VNLVSVRKYLLAGLVVWLPILVTVGAIRFIVELLDNTVQLIPVAYQPEHMIGVHIPGLGVLVSLVLLLTTGLIATNYLGQRLVNWGEVVLSKIPLVRTIYNAVKQIINTLVSSNGDAFRKVLLIEYPRAGLWTLAFQTGFAAPEVNVHTQKEMISLFVPTTPNPTSGFFMMVAKKEVIELNMSIDEALKIIISLGVMQPKAVTNS
jgi:uncharacterized membrane protein